MITKNNICHTEMRCSNCSSSLLDRIGTEIYCLQCETINHVLQSEIQVVPIAYQSNSKCRKELDMERKMSAHIRQFVSKYGSICQEEEIKLLRQKLIKIKKMTPNAKGTRQTAAVVVYCGLKDEIKLSIPDFCKQNKLKHKMFNQKYIIYHRIYPSVKQSAMMHSFQKDSHHFIKKEERIDQESNAQNQQKVIIYEEQSSEDKSLIFSLQDIRKGIEIVFNDIFPNFYLKEQRQTIIKKLASKISQIPQENWPLTKTQTLCKPVQLYYLIFAIIKTLGYKIVFERYSDIITKNTGYMLRKTLAFQIKRSYDEICKKEKEAQSQSLELIEVNGIKIEDNNPEVLRIRFPVADSQNEFQYEYYFQEEFYA